MATIYVQREQMTTAETEDRYGVEDDYIYSSSKKASTRQIISRFRYFW